jgi:hypothetical protein
MSDAGRFQSYEEFWPFYVREHSNATCRALHFIGTTLALACLIAGITYSLRWLIAAPIAGYLFAWIGHFVFEKNRPATFQHPLWSLRGDLRMWRYMLTGRMRSELARSAAAK